jgi:beta-carotene hydroxylase
MTHKTRIPLVPVEFYQTSLLGTTALIVYSLALFLVPALLCRLIATSFDSLTLRIILMVPLTIIAGYGLQLMGVIGHEAIHMSLHRNKIVSLLLGLFFSSMIVTYFEMGFGIRHWNHHRFTNQASDPDIQPVSHLKTWWQRLLFTRPIINLIYFKTTLALALGGPWPLSYKMPLKLSTVRVLCWINFAFALFWLVIYTGVALYDPFAGVFSIALPMIAVAIINSCQNSIDHAGTSDELFRNAWSRTSPLMTAVYFGTNYHLEHHLYPGIPCYRLHKVYKLLKESGFYDQVKATIEPSFFRAYGNLAADYTVGMDSSFDPFETVLEPRSVER